MHPSVHSSTIPTVAKTWKQTECLSTDEWIKKMWYVYIQWNITQLQKNENLAFAATQMDLESIMLSEISKGKTEKCLPSLLMRKQLTVGQRSV